jgi:hypothetical protein
MTGDIDFSQGVSDAWRSITTFVPRLLAFLAILLIGYLIAKAIAKLIDTLLEKVGLDRALSRGGITRAMVRTGYEPSDVIAKLVFYALMLFVLELAFQVWGPNAISDVIQGIIAFLPRIFVAIAIVVVAMLIANAVRDIVVATVGGLSYGRMLATASYIVIAAIGVFAALNQLKIATPIVNGLFYAILALIVGIGIVAVGGGGIGPMREVWQRGIDRVRAEGPRLRQEAALARSRRTSRTDERVERD